MIMKKNYMTPEVEVIETEMIKCILEASGDVVPTGNEGRTFDEHEIATDMTGSTNLWDD